MADEKKGITVVTSRNSFTFENAESVSVDTHGNLHLVSDEAGTVAVFKVDAWVRVINNEAGVPQVGMRTSSGSQFI